MGRLSGKTAVITGAGQGLGLAIAELFAKEGAKVVGTGRHVEKVEKAFAAVKAEHPDYEMTAMQHDVASKEEWEKVMADTAAKYGSVDVVVNNAAIMAMKGILEASAEEFMNVYKTNCLAVLLSIQAAVLYMEKAGKGSIVNASRSIMTAWKKNSDLKPEEFATAARLEAEDMKNKLNAALKNRKYV